MRISFRSFAPIVAIVFAEPLSAQTAQTENKIWLTWEQRRIDPSLCEQKYYCEQVPVYMSRLVEKTSEGNAQSIIGALDNIARARQQPVELPDAPTWCQMTDAKTILGFDAESWPISEKQKALAGLQGVYFKLDGLKGPPGYEGPFGPQVHAQAEDRFARAGIPVLTEEEMQRTPGQPHLNIYFSNTNPDTGCWFSVFASLAQTMLLTRNHTVKIKGGTWGFSGGYSPDDPSRAEFDAIMIVVDKFIADFTAANPNGIQKNALIR